MLNRLIYELDAMEHEPASRPERSAADLLEEVSYLAEHRFWQYTPSQQVPYYARLTSWLLNTGLQRRDVRTLLELAAALQFVDRDDMAALWRGAFRGPITRWLVTQVGWDLNRMLNATVTDRRQIVQDTWFCPITDSMDIGQFLRINDIGGNSRRPGWKTLAQFGDFSRVRQFMTAEGYKRLVLLEDFVGSGTQTVGPIKRALRELEELDVSILFVALSAAETALRRFRRIEARHARFSYAVVNVIPRTMHVFARPIDSEPALFARVRTLAKETFPVVGEPLPSEADPPRSPFGFSRVLGLLFIQHTNCPNNTLPLVWHDSPGWHALFPRVPRQ